MRCENAEPLPATKFQMQRPPFDGARRVLRGDKCKEPGRMVILPGSSPLRLDFKGNSTSRVMPLQWMIENSVYRNSPPSFHSAKI